MKHILVIGLVVLLASCADNPWNKQTSAGLTDADISFHEDGTLKRVKFRDGKEKSSVSLSANIKEGTLSYTATDVLAFDAFATRAEVEKAVAEQWPELAGEASEILTSIITKAVGIP